MKVKIFFISYSCRVYFCPENLNLSSSWSERERESINLVWCMFWKENSCIIDSRMRSIRIIIIRMSCKKNRTNIYMEKMLLEKYFCLFPISNFFLPSFLTRTHSEKFYSCLLLHKIISFKYKLRACCVGNCMYGEVCTIMLMSRKKATQTEKLPLILSAWVRKMRRFYSGSPSGVGTACNCIRASIIYIYCVNTTRDDRSEREM